MCFNTAYKLVLCLLRRLGSLNDHINAPVAGFLSALSIGIDTGKRRELLIALTMSRAIDSTVRISEDAGVVPKSKYRDIILWTLANTFLQSCYGLNQGLLNPGIAKFFGRWSQMYPNDKKQVDVWHRMLADGVSGF